MTHLLLTVHFLDDRYHGLLDKGGPPEWPPSPFRLFQALVAGVARRRELVIDEDEPSNVNFTPIGQALGWLQKHTQHHPPIIIAPKSKIGQAITRFVPNNDGDKKFDRQERLTAKPTIPTLFLLEPDQKPEVHYIWDISDAPTAPMDRIRVAARSLTTLGWGIDMAFADARSVDPSELQELKGVRWYPKKRDGQFEDTLRIPTYDNDTGECTLCDLRHCHSTFINRIEHGKPLKTVDKPKVFERVLYTSTERLIGRQAVVFKLLDEDFEPTRYPHALTAHIAGVMRHAAIECMKGNEPSWLAEPDRTEWVSRFIRGKNDPPSNDHQQVSYIPLPSIGHEHADAKIRNVMIVAPMGRERDLEHLADRLNGSLFNFKGDEDSCNFKSTPKADHPYAMSRFTPPRGRFIATHYLGRSATWQSVTPVILDEHAKKMDRKNAETGQIEKVWNHDLLICKALARAGIETSCEFTWQSMPFYKNCLSAHRYDRNGGNLLYLFPKRLAGKTAVHLKIWFHDGSKDRQPVQVPGPITLGAGRHCGFGLMAATD